MSRGGCSRPVPIRRFQALGAPDHPPRPEKNVWSTHKVNTSGTSSSGHPTILPNSKRRLERRQSHHECTQSDHE
eukprot:gene3231-biopygen11917